MKTHVLSLLLLLSFSGIYAQTQISGKVVGGAGNPPLPGVTVVIKGSKPEPAPMQTENSASRQPAPAMS
jgi:hypothetical protein